MKTLLIILLFISITYNSISQTEGALLPSRPIELPPDRTPSIPIPEPMLYSSDIIPRDREAQPLEELRRGAAQLVDPA